MGTEVGNFLRSVREDRNVSQKALASALGLSSAQSISNIERGVSPLPHRLVPRICGFFEISLDGFVETLLHEHCCRIFDEMGHELAQLQRRKNRDRRIKWAKKAAAR